MKVYQITDKEFLEYGMPLVGYDFTEFLQALSTLAIPEDGIIYEPSVEIFDRFKG